MNEEKLFVTVNHMEDFFGSGFFKVNDELTMKKDRNNEYDDEAIAVYRRDMRCGYVANSVHTVARGTYSAGRIYDKIGDEVTCIVRFVTDDMAIVQLK